MLKTRRSRRSSMAVLSLALVVALQSSPSANHSWNGYHWARTSNPFLVQLGDDVNTAWDAYLAVASDDWSKVLYGNPVRTAVVSGRTSPRNCRPTSGQDEICNASYGNTGWLGVAQIWVSGSHITQGTVKLNDTYFNTSTYNKPAWRQFVVCQEVGHTFGLDHQNTNFNDTNLGSCMDYTSDPDGAGPGTFTDNEHPNQHDYEELALIYTHLDTTNTVKSSPAVSRANLDHHSEWGQLMSTTRRGRAQRFERDFGNGERIVTFVIWA